MLHFLRGSGLPARRRRKADRGRYLRLESLEPRLALAADAGILDTATPALHSASLPAAGTLGTASELMWNPDVTEPTGLVGKQAVSDAIPAMNTTRIRVDVSGPIVAGYGDFVTLGRRVSLRVTFDGPVRVTGRPWVPVTIGGVPGQLVCTAGSGTARLTFSATVPKTGSVEQPMFRDTSGLAGPAIILPAGAAIRNRLGVSVSPLVPLPSLPHQQARNGEIYAAVTGSLQLWAITPDGKHRRQLTFRERDGLDRASHPTVSPDGTMIAFSGFTGDKADVYTIRADGTNLRKITSSNPGEYQFIPGFSPDGRLIAYASSRGEPSPDVAHLRIIAVDGSGDRQLTATTDGTYEDTGPKFSPRGDVIVFGSDRGNTREHNDIYTINVDGSNLRRLTHGANNSYSRSWSPDGRLIVFNSQVRLNGADPGYGELRIMNADGSAQRKLTSFRRNLRFAPVEPVPGGANAPTLRGDITPAWSPDVKFIVFCGQSIRTGQYELFTINLVTRKRTQLTHSAPGLNHISAAWSVLPKTGLSLG